jgi:NAD+ diphosphatase
MPEFIASSFTPPSAKNEPALWFILCGDKLLVNVRDGRQSIPAFKDISESGFAPLREHYLGRYKKQHCYAAEVEKTAEITDKMALQSIWGMFNYLDKDLFKLTLMAFHILNWDRKEQFCVQCGSKTENKGDERAKKCTKCGHVSFLRISPAVIMLISQGDRILLARSQRFKDEMYSVLAGFVEPGETLEDTVKREIREEVGIDVKDIRYFGSQPWPFPDSLMIGFTAHYAGGDIRIDGSEIVDAQWFNYNNLPPIPGKISIARNMIDWFIEKQRTGEDRGGRRGSRIS